MSTTITSEQLSTLSLKELIRLETRLPALIEKAHEQALARANQAFASKLSAVAAEYGLKPSEIAVPASGNGKARKVAKVAKRKYTVRKPIVAKYRDPANPARTWSGKGPTPRWIKETGKDKSAFAVTG